MKYMFLAVLTIILVSCSEDDKLGVITQDTVTRGAVLRTINIDPSAYDAFDASSLWTIVLEEQDIEDGDLLESVDVLVNFVDTTPANGLTEATETMLETIPASAFTKDVNGLPRTTYSLSLEDALKALGLLFDPTVVTGGDQINVRFILHLTDGRSFTDVDATGNVSGGSFFASPFNYRATLVCPPKAGTPGTWTIDMQDSFGDGWNGASLDVTIDSETTQYTFTTGFGAQFNFEIESDTEVLSIVYSSGQFDSENTFQVINPANAVILDLGPSPEAGVELLDYCADF